MLALTLPRGADAKTFVCASGDVQCLIQSINEANANGHPQNKIHLASGTYTLTGIDNRIDGENGLPSITSKLTIDVIGTGTATLDRASGSPNFRLLHVGPTGKLTLRGLTLTHGLGTPQVTVPYGGGGLLNHGGVVTIRDGVFANNGGYHGGLVNYGGIVRIINSTFTRNRGENIGGLLNQGGGVFIVDSTFEQNEGLGTGGLDNSGGGEMRVIRSRVTDNHSGFAAGGLTVSSGKVRVHETTFRGNSGPLASGIYVGTGLTESPDVVVTDSSIVENTVGPTLFNGGTLRVRNTTIGGNIRESRAAGPIAISNSGQLFLVNSTLAGNVAHLTGGSGLSSVLSSALDATTILKNTIIVHDPAEPLIQDCQGTITSRGNNIIGDLTGCTVNFQPGDLIGDAGLGPFTDDGTPGNGHFPLLKDSQAVDAGNDAFCPKHDQIGEERHGQCDIGAIEFQPKKHGHYGRHDREHNEADDLWPLD